MKSPTAIATDAAMGFVSERWTGDGMADLNQVAFFVGQYVGQGEIPYSVAELLLRREAKRRGYDSRYAPHSVRATIETSLASGMLSPQPVPANDNVAPPLIAATPYIWRSTDVIPLREYLYGKHLIRRFLTTDIAPGGAGKSTQIVADALAMVTGRDLLGDEPAGKLRAWLWNGEDAREETERKIAAACAYYKIGSEDVGDRLFVDSGREMQIVVAAEARNKTVVAVPIVEAVMATIRRSQIDVFVVDPFISSHAVSENDNTAVAGVATLWSHIADACGCAVQLVHHVRKGDGRELTADDARGASALVNASRFVRVLNPMTPAQESEANLKPGDRFRFFHVTGGKANLTPRSGRSEWREIVSQPMHNGDVSPLGRPQDFVGVVTRWAWPSAASVVEGLPSAALDEIKTRIRAGAYKEHQLANDWAGYVVADVLGIDLESTAEKKRVKRMLTAWTKAGHFKIEMHRDPKKREDKPYLVVAEDQSAPV